jgi:hypothetical protein
MKHLFLTIQQAKQLGSDLIEYSKIKDSSDRELFKGFDISFGDMLANEPQPDQSLEMTPIPEFTEISKDT